MMSRADGRSAVVTLGTFDGVHRGHQALLKRARERARARGIESAALTFRKPPRNYLGTPKPLLLPPEKKLELLGRFVERVVVLDFPRVREWSPREFVEAVLVRDLHAQVVVVGENFRFGRDRRGDESTLRTLGKELGFEVEVVESVRVDGEVVSSTAIRRAIRAGEVERAARLLGRPPQLWGRVVPGSGQGRRLGFPTANLSVDPEMLVPAEGIYAAWALFRGEKRPGALYIGRRPTLGEGEALSVEVYIVGLPEETSLYGVELEVQLLARIREDRRFDSLEALKAQIARDVARTREFFAKRYGLEASERDGQLTQTDPAYG